MSGGGDDDSEKSHEPSQRRLDQAREQGDVPRANDLYTAAGYGGLLIALALIGEVAVKALGNLGMVLLDQPDRLAPLALDSSMPVFAGIFLPILPVLAGIFLLPAALVLATGLASGSIVFSGERLAPKLSRLSPISNAAHKFGLEGLFEFSKSVLKSGAILAVLTLMILQDADRIGASLFLSPGQGAALMADLVLRFLGIILLIAVVFGAGDFLWQVFRHRARNRMSLQELREEMKESEGDPHARQERRQRGQEIALNRMISDVAKADVVIVNPTHYAVALAWDRKKKSAPKCLAKGVDEVAARIRAKAAEAGVPLHSDPPTARLLHAGVEIGEEIRPEHYRAVAAAIRFADKMKKRRKLWQK